MSITQQDRQLAERIPMPCPFCSGKAQVMPFGSSRANRTEKSKHGYLVVCNCGAKGAKKGTVHEAVDHWNGRPLLAEAREAQHKASWLPISGAPRDGTRILVFNPDDGKPEVAWYDDSEPRYKWTTYDNGYLEGWCEYWQPLPAPPITNEGE